MALYQRNFSRFVYTLLLLSLASTASGTNWTKQYHLCKTNTSISDLQHLYNLTLVASTPTHAALHPSWPETLVTLIICIYSVFIFAFNGRDGFEELGWFTFIGQILIPFILLLNWIISVFVAKKNNTTGGWVAVNLLSYFSLVCVIAQWTNTNSSDGPEAAKAFSTLVGMTRFILGKLQFFGSLIVVAQRWNSGMGSVAYNNTNTNGCMAHHGLAYLEKGARSHVFKSIQTLQVVWAYLMPIALIVVMSNMEKGHDDCVDP